MNLVKTEITIPGYKAYYYPYTMVGDYTELFVYLCPLYNCQTFSIANIQQILGRGYSSEKIRDIFTQCKNSHKFNTKPQCLVDIHVKYLEELEAAFTPEQFLVKSIYTNNTGSEMVMCLIKLI